MEAVQPNGGYCEACSVGWRLSQRVEGTVEGEGCSVKWRVLWNVLSWVEVIVEGTVEGQGCSVKWRVLWSVEGA